jgi:hypothetical protein
LPFAPLCCRLIRPVLSFFHSSKNTSLWCGGRFEECSTGALFLYANLNCSIN